MRSDIFFCGGGCVGSESRSSVGGHVTLTSPVCIRRELVKERVAPVTVKERVTVGATLPADVELRAVPSDWGPSVSRYRYFYSDNNVNFVEPDSRRVVHVLD